MKKKWIVALTVVMALVGLAGCQKGPEGVVAEVNGEPITREQFDAEYGYVRNYIAKQNGEEYLEQADHNGILNKYNVAQNVLNNLEERLAITQDAESLGVEITDQAVEEHLAEFQAQLVEENGDSAYQEYLENNMMDEAFLKESIRLQMLMDAYETEKMKTITIEDEELEKYFKEHKEEYTQVELSAILVNAAEEAADVKARLDAGEDFATLAKEVSIDKVTAENGGSFGYIYRGMLPQELEDKIFGLEVGEYSEPDESENGYYIFHVTDKKEDLEDVKETVLQMLQNQRFQDEVQKVVKAAKVKEYLDYKTVE